MTLIAAIKNIFVPHTTSDKATNEPSNKTPMAEATKLGDVNMTVASTLSNHESDSSVKKKVGEFFTLLGSRFMSFASTILTEKQGQDEMWAVADRQYGPPTA